MTSTRAITAAGLACLAFVSAPLSAAASPGSEADYRASLQCASLHIIAGQVLSRDADQGEALQEQQADLATEFVDFALAQKPGMSESQLDADLMAQMDADVARITAPGAKIRTFLDERVPMCEKLHRKF